MSLILTQHHSCGSSCKSADTSAVAPQYVRTRTGKVSSVFSLSGTPAGPSFLISPLLLAFPDERTVLAILCARRGMVQVNMCGLIAVKGRRGYFRTRCMKLAAPSGKISTKRREKTEVSDNYCTQLLYAAFVSMVPTLMLSSMG